MKYIYLKHIHNNSTILYCITIYKHLNVKKGFKNNIKTNITKLHPFKKKQQQQQQNIDRKVK